MINKPTNRIQSKIMKTLGETKELKVNDLTDELGVSHVYIRQQLSLLMEAGLVERVDDRQPYIYRKKQLNLKELKMISNIKQAMLTADKEQFDKIEVPMRPFLALFHKVPKSNWHEIFESFELYERAVEELNAEGKLIDTL